MRRIGSQIPAGLLAGLVCLAALVLLPAIAAAAEEETHLFDATLSLTGDCTTSETIDPVPDPGCPDAHAPKPFTKSGAVAVDDYGNRYVASAGAAPDGSEGRIDVFDSSGTYITEVKVSTPKLTISIAVDSEGYLYAGIPNSNTNEGILRYKPTEYNPAAGEIEYDPTPAMVQEPRFGNGWGGSIYLSLAINPADDHLFVADGVWVTELNSAAEGNVLVGYLKGLNELANALAIDSVRERIYVSDWSQNPATGGKPVVKVFDLEDFDLVPPQDTYPDPPPPYDPLFVIDGSTTPTNRFVSETRLLPVAVDEASGHVFVGDLNASTRQVYEFDADGNPVSTIAPEAGFKSTATVLSELAYDDSPTSPTQGYLFVPSHNGPGRSLAFAPKPTVAAPIAESLSASGVTADEAILHAKVNPKGVETTYRFEYTTEPDFQASGFAGATLADEGTLKPANEGIAVSTPVSGLLPGAAYRFRLVAESVEGSDEKEASFATYASPELSTDCPNQALRTGPSSLLPDCRAYELVTPSDTNGHSPFGQQNGTPLFPSSFSSPDGNRVSFQVDGGGLPGIGATGSFFGDPYLASRGQEGWQTEYTGPSAAFAVGILPGSSSSDQAHSLWRATGPSPARLEGDDTTYVRYPDGHSELLGKGSLATDPGADIKLASENASHLIFITGGVSSTGRQLEPGAPPDGTGAIYDRTLDGTTHVVSLLPGDIPLGAGQNAFYEGASPDGEGVAFGLGNTLYLRHDNEETYEIGAGVQFAGVSEGGARLFYMEGGDLGAFDVATEATIPFSQSGDVIPVNVSADGKVAYFVSPSVLTGEANPEEDIAQAGEENLYLSREGQISFVGALSQRDVEGVKGATVPHVRGLGLWLDALSTPAIDPSRTTSSGNVLLFESNAKLTGYDPEGHTQLYRYDAGANTLRCLSCNPTGAPATGEGALQALDTDQFLLTYWNPIDNLSSDGTRAFFESTEALVVSDTDGLRDVYEWEEEGVGGCQRTGGCLYLISSGQSGRDDYLYAVSDSGDDVFFRSADLLAPAFDPDETPSIYDARINGGFAVPSGASGECLGEACQPAAVAPNDPTPASSTFRGAGNVTGEKTRAHKKKHRKAKKKHASKKHRKHANANRRAGR